MWGARVTAKEKYSKKAGRGMCNVREQYHQSEQVRMARVARV